MSAIKIRTSTIVAFGLINIFILNLLQYYGTDGIKIVFSFWFFAFIMLFPGMLILMLLGSRRYNLNTFLLSVPLSILVIIFAALCTNVLPFEKPLNTNAASIIFSVFIGLLLTSIAATKKTITIPAINKPNRFDILLFLASTISIILGVLNAIRLNNLGSNVLGMICLVIMALLVFFVAIFNKKMHLPSILFFIFSTGLTILLMTSLRSNFITGHDIQIEYRVFNLTLEAGRWSIENFRNSYNACLSITLFPVILSKLLSLPGLIIFKVLFQILFALVPIYIYSLSRNFTGRFLSYLSAVSFICFVTFVNDSPMLTRQEIAFVFLSGLFLVWFEVEQKINLRTKRILIMLLFFGLTISHYSSTYTFLATLLLYYFMSWIFKNNKYQKIDKKNSVFNFSLIAICLLGAFLWYAQTTQTLDGLIGAVSQPFKQVTSSSTQRNKAIDTSYSIFSFEKPDRISSLNRYIQETSSKTDGIPTYELSQSDSVIDDKLPKTKVSTSIKDKTGFDLSTFISNARLNIARIIQLTLALSIVIWIYSKIKRSKKNTTAIPDEYMLFLIASVCVLAMILVLPSISLNYGILRAFQQGLLIFSTVIIITLSTLLSHIFKNKSGYILAIILTCYFCLFSGLLPQLVGGADAQLNLNNKGQYFGYYYVYKGDLAVYAWAQENISRNGDVHGPNFAIPRSIYPRYPFYKVGILPFQLSSNSSLIMPTFSNSRSAVYINDGMQKILLKLDLDALKNRNILYVNQGASFYGKEN